MKRLCFLVVLMVLSSSAYAGNSLSLTFGGHRIHIEAPRHCRSTSCVSVSIPGIYKGRRGDRYGDEDRDVTDRVKAPVAQQPAPVAVPAPATVAVAPPPLPTVETAPAPAVTAAPAPTPAQIAVAPAPANSPLGVWATEENKGNVRIESCGDRLCGYAVKTGEKILINMKQQDSRWTGKIHDPDSGRNYDSTIAMKGANALKVQGCAFGGMFCGGQTWKRVS